MNPGCHSFSQGSDIDVLFKAQHRQSRLAQLLHGATTTLTAFSIKVHRPEAPRDEGSVVSEGAMAPI